MNMHALMKQAQQMQAKMARIEKEVNETTYLGTAGGGAVKVEVLGSMEVTSLEIDPEMLSDREFVSESIMLAVNQALASAKQDREEKLGTLTQGVKMPGMF